MKKEHTISTDETITLLYETKTLRGAGPFVTIEKSEAHSADEGETVFSYSEALELHAFLTEVLGLSTPTPTSPLTASKAYRLPDHEGEALYPNVLHYPGGRR